MLRALLSLYCSIEISTFSWLSFWNLYFLFTFLLKSLLSLYFFIPQTVCPHYGVLTVRERSGVLRGVLPQPRLSTEQARTEFRLRRQCRTEWLPRDFGSFYRVPVHFLKQNVVLRDRCRRSDGFGGSKRDFTWQVQGIGHFVKIVAGAVVCGRCQNVGRRVSFEGLRFTWQAQGIRTMDAMFWGRKARFLRRVAFLELQLEDQFAWPVQHFVWPRVMISWQAQYFWNMLQFSWKSRTQRSFWSSGSPVFEEVSHKTLVLELRIFSFRRCLAQNARFGSPESSVFEEVSHKTLVLELRIFSFRRSLAQNARFEAPDLQFSRKSRTKRSFWSSGSSILEEVSQNLLVYNILIHMAQKWILTQRSWDRNLAEVVLQDPDRSDPTGSWYRDLAQVSS